MSKNKSCCVLGCKNQNIGADSGVIFYKFPEEKNLKKKWIAACINNEAIKDKNWEPDSNSAVCNVHFVTGHKNPNDWHPDYVPSVFRSLRRVITKAKGKHLDESDDESKGKRIKTPSKTPTVKRLQATNQLLKRGTLSTPTRNTPKRRGPAPLSVKRAALASAVTPAATSTAVKKSGKLSAGRPPKAPVEKKEKIEIYNNLTPSSPPSSPFKLSNDEDSGKESLKFSDAGRPVRNKRKRLGDEYEESPVLKTLSVVLERTSAKKIKLSTGEITIKEEPESESDYTFSPSNISPMKRYPCKKCSSLEQKVRKLEISLKKSPGTDRCRRCPIIEHKLKKVEEELDDIIDAKVSKCQKCLIVEQKCKRVESNLRKAQTEVNKLQAKLANIEITEEAFKKYKSKVKMYTGFPNYEALMLVFEHVKPHLPAVVIKVLSPFQMFVIVLMRLKLNFPFWDLTYRFGSSPNHIQSFYPQYISILEAHLSHVVLWPKANLYYRLQVLASNLKQSFCIIQDKVEVETLMVEDTGKFSEDEKAVRVCAALYHIAQLVSSNHSLQLVRILKSKDETDRTNLLEDSQKPDSPITENLALKEDNNGEESNTQVTLKSEDRSMKNEKQLTNGNDEENEDVDDSDIFFEDLTKDIGGGINSNDSLELECKHLRRELDSLTQKLTSQFRFYTGMRNFEVFNNLLGFLQSQVTHISKEKLTYFQQLHMVLIRLKLNLEVQDLAYLFNVDPDHIVYLTRLWIDVMVQKLSRYIDWPAGVEDADGEKRLLGTVKLKYQILWNPQQAPRNKETGREREKLDMRKLLRACAALYNIDDIEVFKDGRKETKSSKLKETTEKKTNEELEQECRDLRTELYDLRKSSMVFIASCYTEETFQNNDHMVRFYTGFPSFEMLMNVFTLIVPATKSESRKSVTTFQQFIILLLRMKLNLATQDLGFRFGMGQSNTHKFVQDWLVLLHSQLAPHITWPDDDEDVEVFTDMLRKTYSYLRSNISPRRKDHERKSETSLYDIATLVCAGLYNVGEVSFCEQSESEFDSFDDEW